MSTQHLPNIGPFATPFDGREIVYWEDSRSLIWLSRTLANKPFLRLARFFEAQNDKFMCGPASIAMVLNALKMDASTGLPTDAEHERYPRSLNPHLPPEYQASFCRYTQRNIFEKYQGEKAIQNVCGLPLPDGRISPGLNLEEMHDILAANDVSSKIVYVENDSFDIHSNNFSHALTSDDQYIIANFDRSVWGLKGAGHVAPIGAFDLVTKKVLVMDVNMCGRWLWIDIQLLLTSMTTLDYDKPRGYLIVSR